MKKSRKALLGSITVLMLASVFMISGCGVPGSSGGGGGGGGTPPPPPPPTIPDPWLIWEDGFRWCWGDCSLYLNTLSATAFGYNVSLQNTNIVDDITGGQGSLQVVVDEVESLQITASSSMPNEVDVSEFQSYNGHLEFDIRLEMDPSKFSAMKACHHEWWDTTPNTCKQISVSMLSQDHFTRISIPLYKPMLDVTGYPFWLYFTVDLGGTVAGPKPVITLNRIAWTFD